MSEMRIRSITDLYNIIQTIGFIPLFCNAVPGFSVEDLTLPSAWWTGNPETDPWIWREILASDENIAYGKFFDKKAGFISRDWLPVFANYRRNGYDYDALFDDGFASFKSKRIMDAFGLDEQSRGRRLMTSEIRAAAGFHEKRETGTFNSVLTELQMQIYLMISSFRQKSDRKGSHLRFAHFYAGNP